VIVGIRHAQVQNVDGVVYARLPGFHLSESGQADAKALADALASSPLGAVYASPLERATETAELLGAPHGLQVRPDERLLEWSEDAERTNPHGLVVGVTHEAPLISPWSWAEAER
jgi:broad specificity phosphatase PhoE